MAKMTVYELIQELSRYEAHTEVRFRVRADFYTEIEAVFDRNDENDVQKVLGHVEFDSGVDLDDITDREYVRYEAPHIQINLKN